ncbi:hypothetical protein [Streptomyces sp. NPDC088254]|uniref:hypothetical protein n=1 Tax=Streptomyces sp. NPDC088254 TaxID=3365847 RepID=UPI0038174E41
MSNEQRNQQPSVPQQQQEQAPAQKNQVRSEIVQKGTLAAISGLCSGAARAILTRLFSDGS